MEKVTAQFPDDNEIAVLYAESVMDLSPWNYWQPGGHAPSGRIYSQPALGAPVNPSADPDRRTLLP